MATTVTLLAPNKNTLYMTRGGSYQPDALGLIYNVPSPSADILDLIKDGCFVYASAPNIGTPQAGVAALELGDAYRHTTILTVASVLPAIAGGAALGVGKKLYQFPAGAHIVKSARFSMGITQTQGNINANTPTVGLGSVVASGVVSVLSGTATFQDIGVGKAAANCTGTATVQAAKATASPFEFISDVAGSKDLFFNAAATWSASGDLAAILAGTVVIHWDTLG